MPAERVSTGIAALDETIQALRWGDNVVFQVEDLADYAAFARAFVREMIGRGAPTVYLRFAPHEPLLPPQPGLEVVEVDPGEGFDLFSAHINRLVEARGLRACYVFDSLSALVEPWATDELLANFFRVTCPYLYELETIAYFALTRGRHANDVVARIADTTQLLIDVYRLGRQQVVHPVKVAGRYAPDMFLPHLVDEAGWRATLSPGAAAEPLLAGQAPAAARPAYAAPWDTVYARLAEAACTAAPASGEVAALKAELRRMLMGDEPHFARLADRYLTVEDLLAVRERMVGSGRVGGKAAGMLLARRILASAGEEEGGDPADLLGEHDAFFIGSDVFFTFLVNNGLFRRRLDLHRRQEDMPHERFADLEAAFLAGEFPAPILDAFGRLIDHYGTSPIIVRSSSFLEDGFGHAFAGKYLSEFCANQGSREERLQAFANAVKRVYASALSPDALAYRRRHGLVASDEQMAILVQRVVGARYGRYYFPSLAGVAFSRNIYPWTDRIDPAKGLVRLVFGLGTRAVDRVEDYPRMVALSDPGLRPEIGRQVVKYSQRQVDVIDLEANALVTLPLEQVLAGRDYPHLHLLVSEMRDGYLFDPVGNTLQAPARDLALTFNNLLRRTPLVQVLRAMLQRLEAAYGHPVDVEFTAHIEEDLKLRVNVLQCRPMSLPGEQAEVRPGEIPPEQLLFRATRMAGGGLVEGIAYIIYVDPAAYAAPQHAALRGPLGRLIGRLNAHPAIRASRTMMVGPGRWGSSNLALGVNVSYADIDHTSVLVELAREEAGQLPEVSFGTHFFQDLVEDQVIYLPVYPDDPAAGYAAGFFSGAPNALLAFLPDAEAYLPLVKVIDVRAATGGLLAHVAADPTARQAACYLAKPWARG